jgi:hypothetical protein
LTWSLPTDEGGDPVTGYNIYKNSELVHSGESTLNTYTFESLSVGIVYELSVTAFNDIGESLFSTLSLKAASVPQKLQAPQFISSSDSQIEIGASSDFASFNGGDSIL